MKTPAPLNKSLLEFLKTEAGSGTLLAIFAVLAIVWANSPFAESYFAFIHTHFTLSVLGWSLDESVLEWTKEGLMAIFFFVVGLEIKYEIFRGELSSPQKLALPVVAAIGGMVVPAGVYVSSIFCRAETCMAGRCPWPPISPLPWPSWLWWVSACRPPCVSFS